MAWGRAVSLSNESSVNAQPTPYQGVMSAFGKTGGRTIVAAPIYNTSQAAPTQVPQVQAQPQMFEFPRIVAMKIPQQATQQNMQAPSVTALSSIWGDDARGRFLDEWWKNRGM